MANVWTLIGCWWVINLYKVYGKKFDNRDQEHFKSYTPRQVISPLRMHSKKTIREVFNDFCMVLLQKNRKITLC